MVIPKHKGNQMNTNLGQAIIDYTNENPNHTAEVEIFLALHSILGDDELYDGIACAMQDEGYEDVYEGIMSHYKV